VALAGAPFGTNWGKWGTDDQFGTLNYITPDGVAAAGKLVKTGKVFNLAQDLAPNTPGWAGRTYRHTFDFIIPQLDPAGGVGAADDAIEMHLQYSTQWDGLPHFFFSGKMYNGYDAATKIVATGAQELSIHQWANKIVARGVLLDIAKYKGVDNLEKGYIITPEDIDATLAAQNVEVKRGDLLLFRTGWIVKLREHAWPMRGNEPYEFGEPGLGLQACKWLKEKQVAALAFDNLAVEAIPFDPEGLEKVNDVGFKGFPVHIELLVWQGMPIGETWNFEELAKDCAEDGVYEFLLIAPPLRVVGGIGSVLSPIAIK
jgi:kynurenine formamidase